MHSFTVHAPTLATQHRPDAAVSVARMPAAESQDPRHEFAFFIRNAAVVALGRAWLPHQLASVTLTGAAPVQQILHGPPLAVRAYHFFAFNSLSSSRSRAWSATIF